MTNSNKKKPRRRQFPNVPEDRRKIMASVGHKDTAAERTVRSMLHCLGYRFTVNGPKNRSLPGSPDIVLPGRKTVVFVHGCFWHGHNDCKKYSPPKVRTEYWNKKIEGNKNRDKRTNLQIKALGWKVIVVWECELSEKRAKKLQKKLEKIPS